MRQVEQVRGASGLRSAGTVIAGVGSSIMTARLGAIMVADEATDVAGVSIGNRRSTLDAKGGCRSTRTTASLYFPLAHQRRSRTAGS
jgi:hypothetical protein